MYRIHFTAQDLARTRVAQAPMPLLELQLAARALRDRSQPAQLDSWRRRARTGLSTPARMALSLIPPVGWSPGCLWPPLTGRPQDLLGQLRTTPTRRIHAELAAIAERQSIPSWARQLAHDAALRQRLYDGISHLYDRLLGPYWPRLADLAADRAIRTRQFLTGGVGAILSQANPQWMRWSPPTLEIRMANGIDYDLYLAGRGVLLVPSAFATRTVVDDEAEPQPVVTYPAGLDQPLRQLTTLVPERTASNTATAVAALLGHTRAAVLTAIAEFPGRSTTELARTTRIAPASASQHAAILRGAGLIRTVRHRNTALHSVTALGAAVLNTAYD